MSSRPSVLYVTDPGYPARGRRYGDEDLALSARLRADFRVALCHPADAVSLMDAFDVVVVRNTGPVALRPAEHATFRRHALDTGARVHNPLTGRGDMRGKRHLVEMTEAGLPVIPTVDRAERIARLPDADAYVVKPIDGADSSGLRTVPADALRDALDGSTVAQPLVRMREEVSFYFVDGALQYALRTVRPDRRWDLVPFAPSVADLTFARLFVEWNPMERGIQRVDACRTVEGDLLLVELEDHNPYLSLEAVDEATRERFVAAMAASVRALVSAV
jgi:hypothetical protein